MSLAAQNTEKGADFAAQSVAKIAITMNPEVAFPGQRVRTNIQQLRPCHNVIIELTILVMELACEHAQAFLFGIRLMQHEAAKREF